MISRFPLERKKNLSWLNVQTGFIAPKMLHADFTFAVLSVICVFAGKLVDKLLLALLSCAEKTGGAAVQRPFLQGRLCRCSSALPETRWPAPPPGNLSHTYPGDTSVCFQETNQCETSRGDEWLIGIPSVTAVALGWGTHKSCFTSNASHH